MADLQKQSLLSYGNGDFCLDDAEAKQQQELPEETKIIRAVNRALHGASHLNNLLPTGTMLAFQVLCPILSNGGLCDTLHRCLTAALLGLCGLSAFLLCFTDSVRTPDGKVFYGIATFRGFCIFGHGKAISGFDMSLFRIRALDFVHGFLSVLVVASMGLSNVNVVDCFYPELPRFCINTVPVVAGFVISILFIMFPDTRKGIGHPVLFSQHPSGSWC